MNIKKYFFDKSIGFYMAVGITLLTLVAFIVYCVYGSDNGFNSLIIVSLIVIFLTELAFIFVNVEILSTYLPLIAPIFCSIILFSFISDNVGTFADYFTDINLFGDVTQMGKIITFIVFMTLTSLAAVAGCFFRREKKTTN